MLMKKSSDTIRNRTRDLPVCSAVPQPLLYRVPLFYDSISLNYSLNEKCFRNFFRENQNTHIMLNNLFYEILAVYRIMCNNMLSTDRSLITI
jgi:hypothetical protein